MITRRLTIALIASAAYAALAADAGQPASEQEDRAIALVERTGAQLIAIAASSERAGEKHRRLVEIIAAAVDVDDIGRFCLGRFWSIATPDQQALYLSQFRELLIAKIAAYLPDYEGVTLTARSVRSVNDLQIVATIVARPDHSRLAVDWVVDTTSGGPKIIDLQAEGTSLRQTQRADFVSFLLHHEVNIDQLNEGMGKLVAINQY